MSNEQKNNKSKLKLTIPDWAVQDRPREKYLAFGFAALSDAELIAILLRNGAKSESAVDVARNLMADCKNNLLHLSEINYKKLLKINGIGKVKAITLLAAFELGKRCRTAIIEQKKLIESPFDLLELMQTKNAFLDYEEFWVVFINNGSVLLSVDNFGKGGITSTAVDVRLIIARALELKATGIMVCHNHPSGDLLPSEIDLKLTTKIHKAAQLMSIQLIDHVIICKGNYYSFLENNLLEETEKKSYLTP